MAVRAARALRASCPLERPAKLALASADFRLPGFQFAHCNDNKLSLYSALAGWPAGWLARSLARQEQAGQGDSSSSANSALTESASGPADRIAESVARRASADDASVGDVQSPVASALVRCAPTCWSRAAGLASQRELGWFMASSVSSARRSANCSESAGRLAESRELESSRDELVRRINRADELNTNSRL